MNDVLVPTAKCRYCGKPLYTSQSERYVYQCFDCDEDFYEMEARYDSVEDRDAAIELLWKLIEDEPFDGETECFESRFYGIGDDCGTEPMSRMDVWHWFDQKHSKGVHYLLYGE